MPNQWIEPGIAYQHADRIVYHTYKDDQSSNGTMTFWFSTDPSEGLEFEFDVRDLPTWDWPGDIERAIKTAIDQGILTFPTEE